MVRRQTRWLVLLCSGSLGLWGCGTPSTDTGEYDRDAALGETDAGQPSSLFEMNFGGGETEVTKNLPADAAGKVGDAIKSTFKPESPPDVSGE